MYMSPHLHHAFEDGTTISHEKWQWKLQQFSPGSLVLTSGKILACDPLAFWEHEPFVRVVPVGTYPIYLTVAQDLKESRHKRVAFARLQFIPNEMPVRWEMAVTAKQNVIALALDQYWGYGVDAGTGSFMDVDAVSQWQILVDTSDDTAIRQMTGEEIPDDKVWTELKKNRAAGREWSNFVLSEETGLNVIVFDSGWGDGSYPSYWGFNAADQVVCLVTDFGIIRVSNNP